MHLVANREWFWTEPRSAFSSRMNKQEPKQQTCNKQSLCEARIVQFPVGSVPESCWFNSTVLLMVVLNCMILYRCYYSCPTPVYEKSSVPFPSTQPTCFPEPRVDFFSSSRPVLGADSEVILADGKTVTVTKPTVCPLSVWWDSEEISRDTWRIFLHFDKERTPRSTYREMKVTGGFFFAAVWQYREKILILHYGCPECEGGRQAEAVHLPHVISPTVTALWGSFVGVMHFGTVAEKTKS